VAANPSSRIASDQFVGFGSLFAGLLKHPKEPTSLAVVEYFFHQQMKLTSGDSAVLIHEVLANEVGTGRWPR